MSRLFRINDDFVCLNKRFLKNQNLVIGVGDLFLNMITSDFIFQKLLTFYVDI